MITLARLVTSASKHYDLSLTAQQQTSVLRKLRIAGYDDELDRAKVSEVVDVIFSLVRSQPSERAMRIRQASLNAGGPRLSAGGSVHTDVACPRCRGQMSGVKLATKQLVDYCRKCKIALPIK